ncbi:signal recognition particle-docking protein FtsY [Cellulomonas sp. WB94]|uniref:signal recognition particle-docking protein FtsY n=1 Tax=Cellulomonas sp. WB94 TaxID=2173174 RepID=UPI000D585180|nr:signal recognition particle-docking protein FtsY [Cellulomonas sp. WB94]PVU81878.1 signal recognition particle-docking protein FtsY [Cellulomonas sp. WB94]
MDNDLLTALVVGVPALAAAAGATLVLVRRRGATPPDAPTVGTTVVDEHATTAVADASVVEAPTAPAPDQDLLEELPGLEEAPPLEVPAPVAGRLARLRDRLARSGSPLGTRLLAVLSRDHLTEDDWDELEETLLLADVGAGPSAELIAALRTQVRVHGLRDAGEVRALLREQLIALVDPNLDRSLATGPVAQVPAPDAEGPEPGVPTAHVPAVVLVVGVNGTGKTTTVGKLARVLVAEGRTVVLGAADTFRAAAADQLETWGARVGVPTVRSDRDGADPAAVAFDAVRTGKRTGADVVLVDTAGRLQNKAGLMDELGKITRVITREAPLAEVLLVLDATTGQNGLNQARVFAEVAGVTGIVLTKLDGTAKGGIVIAVQRELGVPVKLIGLGEGPDDLAPFDPEAFVDGLLQA